MIVNRHPGMQIVNRPLHCAHNSLSGRLRLPGATNSRIFNSLVRKRSQPGVELQNTQGKYRRSNIPQSSRRTADPSIGGSQHHQAYSRFDWEVFRFNLSFPTHQHRSPGYCEDRPIQAFSRIQDVKDRSVGRGFLREKSVLISSV